MHWQVQEAKEQFDELLREAQAGETQFLTNRDDEVAVVMSIEEYRRLTAEPVSFMDYLRVNPVADADFEVERLDDLVREAYVAG